MGESADSLIREGYLARRKDRSEDALRHFKQAVSLSRASGARWDLIRALRGEGQIERDLGCHTAALPLYEEALALCRQEGDPASIANAVRHLGDVHQDLGSLDSAELCFEEALVLYRGQEGTPPLLLANAIRPTAILKGTQGKTEEAIRLWKQAKALYEEAGIAEGVAECADALECLST